MNERLSKLTELVKGRYDNDDPSHDWLHIGRVIKTCKLLAEDEGADLETLLPAAYLHDVINVPKNSPDRLKASQMAAEEAKGILRHVGYREEEIEKIAQVIIEHSYSLGLKPTSIESAILQDADRLDALGAIGMMRHVTVGTRMGASYYHAEEPFAKNRELEDRKYSLDHYEVKLFKLLDKMNTPAGQKEAKKRTKFMRSFLEQLKTEIH